MNPTWKWDRFSIGCAAVYIIAVMLFCYFWYQNAAWDWFWGTVAGALVVAASFWLWLWQKGTGRVLPTVEGYHAAMIPGVLSLIAIVVPAVVFFWMRPGTGTDALDASFIIGLVFGGATMLSLGVSLAVLVQIQTAFTGEKELLKHATDALRLVRTKLIFVTLTPNLGYAACVERKDDQAIHTFHLAMRGALQQLRYEMNCGKQVRVLVATLCDADVERFYKSKAHGLVDREGLNPCESGAVSYDNKTKLLATELKDLLSAMKGSSNGNSVVKTPSFTECLEDSETVLKVKDNTSPPPLGFLLAEERMGVVFFHESLLTEQPVGLRGYITRDPEHVRALETLSYIYVGETASG